MAIEQRRYRVDDLAALRNPRVEVLADETISFAVNGAQYEIDLSAKNAGSFFEAVKPFQQAGRRVRQPRRARRTADRRQTAEVRSWARENGHEVSNWGRLPAGVVEQYEAAQAALAT